MLKVILCSSKAVNDDDFLPRGSSKETFSNADTQAKKKECENVFFTTMVVEV